MFEAFGEALWGVLARPARLVGAGVAASLGIGLFVATWTVGVTAERQVADTFDALRATEVRVVGVRAGDSVAWVPADYRQRLSQLPAVVAVEHLTDFGEAAISPSGPERTDLGPSVGARVWGVGVRGPSAMRAVVDGQWLDEAAARIGTPTALVGARLARDLGIQVVDGVRAVWVDGSPFVIRGIITEIPLRPELLDSIVVLRDQALAIGLNPAMAEIVIETSPGGAATVASQAPLALRPEDPSGLTAIAPPGPEQFRQRIEGDIRVGLLAVSGIAVLVGVMALSNAIALSVISRTSEIGLRRALGARSPDVFATVVAEGAIIGLFGGVLGSSLGVAGAIGLAVSFGWNPVVVPLAPVLGTVSGVAVGIAAGIPPGVRAIRIEPVDALRSAG